MLHHFALIGCGQIAKRHAAEINKVGRLAAVCDIIKERADSIAFTYDARAYYDIKDLLAAEKNIDIAVICSPNGLHARHAIACIRSGLDVLCEKPMAIHSTDARNMIAAAVECKRKLFVVK